MSTAAKSVFVKMQPFDPDTEQWRVVVETPKYSRNKYKFDEELNCFSLSGVLPEGMSFPYDFGFLPNTQAADGDPIDVLLLMDEPAFCGCVVPARLIGVIEAQQTERDGTSTRNDRLIAVAGNSRTNEALESIKDLDENRLNELQQFFVSYNRVRGKTFKVLSIGGPHKAEKLAKDSMKQKPKSAKKRTSKAR